LRRPLKPLFNPALFLRHALLYLNSKLDCNKSMEKGLYTPMKFRHLLLLAFSTSILTAPRAPAQGAPPALPPAPEARTDATPPNETAVATAPASEAMTNTSPVLQPANNPMVIPPVQSQKLQSFEFVGADLDTVMTMYCEWNDKIYLKNDAVNASISLKADRLSIPECIDVVEAILAMNNIAIVPFGEKFIKVVNVAEFQKQGAPIELNASAEYAGTDRLVTQLIQLQNVQITDVQTAIQHLMHSYGTIQTLEGSNSLLVTDTESNILRIRELVEFIDQASAKIEFRFYRIEHSEAAEIAGILNEIINMAQQSTTGRRTSPTSATTRNVVRAVRPTTPAARTQAAISSAAYGGPSIIQGDVKVMADERTNLILIFSQKENFDFFDKIIASFDVEVDPAITFEVVNLEYADAEELAGTLNELVGAAQGSRSLGSGSTSSSRSRSSSSRSSTSRSSTSRSSSGTSGGTRTAITPNAAPEGAAGIANLNQLSEETRILADIRSNSILLMGIKSDINAIKQLIASLDVLLEQVVIEAAIFEIGLNDELRHGVDWLYRAAGDERIAAWDGNSLITNAIQNVAANALTYYQFFPDLDSQMLINIAKTDSDSRLISTPVIMTTDNTEAVLSIGEQRPVVTSTDTYASNLGGQRSNYEYKDIGIQLSVTPRINPQRFVVMEISQQADDVGPIVTIDNNEVPIILNREFDATVAVPDGGTVVLGGLMKTDVADSVRKIPILGDIPLIGRYLFSSVTKTEDTNELLVLMTPYVMANMEEMTGQTERLYRGTTIKQEDWGEKNWSESPLRDIPDDRSTENPNEEPPPQNPPVEEDTRTSSEQQQKDEINDLLNTM
jgi:general secretion pathway protein D